MAQCEAAVDFSLLGVLRREERLKLIPAINFAGVFGAVGFRPGEEIVLNGLQTGDDAGDEFSARDARLLAGIAAGSESTTMSSWPPSRSV